MKPIDVSVVIPHYQDLLNLDRCLSALQKQTFPTERFEIVVADNGSSVGADVVGKLIGGRASLVVVHKRGAGPARNGGVAASRGRILAFTDSDCVPSPEWLAAGFDALSTYDFVGGRVDVSAENEERLTPTEAFERIFAFDFERYIKKKGFTGSGNLFVSRSVFDRVGGFRDKVSEDVDWSRRATALGYKLGYAPTAVVSHPARRSWADLRSKWERINRETYALVTPGYGNALWLLRTLALPGSIVVHFPRVLLSSKLKSPKERIGALTILVRSRLWRLADALRLMLSNS